jgi:hypothetical protein
MAPPPRVQDENELSEGFMLYSGFVGGEVPSTPRAKNRQVDHLDLQNTPKQTKNGDKMVYAGNRSPREGSHDDYPVQDSPPPGKLNPIGVQDELDDTAYSYALRVA